MRYLRYLTVLTIVLTARAEATIPDVYHATARDNAIPVTLLYGVCLQESGLTRNNEYHPWPWVLNIAGEGQYLNSYQDALDMLNQTLADPDARCRVDIGLCQIHWCSHAHRLDQPEDLLNPYVNLRYAARLLREEFDRHGSWGEAVGRYHSYQPKRAEQYTQRVVMRLQTI